MAREPQVVDHSDGMLAVVEMMLFIFSYTPLRQRCFQLKTSFILYSISFVQRLSNCLRLCWLLPLKAVRVVDAVGLSGLPYARPGLHQPRGRPATDAIPRPPRTDEVRDTVQSEPGLNIDHHGTGMGTEGHVTVEIQ